MKRFRVRFGRGFDDDLQRYEFLLANYTGPHRVEVIAAAIVDAGRRLESAPLRGTDWSHVRPGLRSLPVLGRGTLLFRVDEVEGVVSVLGWWWRGAPLARVVRRYR